MTRRDHAGPRHPLALITLVLAGLTLTAALFADFLVIPLGVLTLVFIAFIAADRIRRRP